MEKYITFSIPIKKMIIKKRRNDDGTIKKSMIIL